MAQKHLVDSEELRLALGLMDHPDVISSLEKAPNSPGDHRHKSQPQDNKGDNTTFREPIGNSGSTHDFPL